RKRRGTRIPPRRAPPADPRVHPHPPARLPLPQRRRVGPLSARRVTVERAPDLLRRRGPEAPYPRFRPRPELNGPGPPRRGVTLAEPQRLSTPTADPPTPAPARAPIRYPVDRAPRRALRHVNRPSLSTPQRSPPGRSGLDRQTWPRTLHRVPCKVSIKPPLRSSGDRAPLS